VEEHNHSHSFTTKHLAGMVIDAWLSITVTQSPKVHPGHLIPGLCSDLPRYWTRHICCYHAFDILTALCHIRTRLFLSYYLHICSSRTGIRSLGVEICSCFRKDLEGSFVMLRDGMSFLLLHHITAYVFSLLKSFCFDARYIFSYQRCKAESD
jgi:hypothetical protein